LSWKTYNIFAKNWRQFKFEQRAAQIFVRNLEYFVENLKKAQIEQSAGQNFDNINT